MAKNDISGALAWETRSLIVCVLFFASLAAVLHGDAARALLSTLAASALIARPAFAEEDVVDTTVASVTEAVKVQHNSWL